MSTAVARRMPLGPLVLLAVIALATVAGAAFAPTQVAFAVPAFAFSGYVIWRYGALRSNN